MAENTGVLNHSSHVAPKLAPFSADPDLLALADAWQDLPAKVRLMIMDLVQRADFPR